MAVPGVFSESPRIAPAAPAQTSLASLFAPLSLLLAAGGDARLALSEGQNKYGCRPVPEPNTIAFSSSTASSISERGYEAAQDARERLLESALARGLDAAFEARVEGLRFALKNCLGLAHTNSEVVFSPSGTDSQLQALFLTRALLGETITSIVVGADQTGSGTTHTARGRHFSARSACGIAMETGAPIAGLAEQLHCIEIGFSAPDGREHSAPAIDAMVMAAVADAVACGRHVLLQTMESSKLGRRGPSDECLNAIRARWPDAVQIVVDACQMRMSSARLREHLQHGDMALITGSKFFGGPAFSGALIVPEALSERLRSVFRRADGLFACSTRFDWPGAWPAIRTHFPAEPNFGQWLRWEAALAEMRAYFAVPEHFRRASLREFAAVVAETIATSEHLELLPAWAATIDDTEFSTPTIFPFVMRRNGRLSSIDETARVYRALGRDLSHLLPAAAPARLRLAAAAICRIGQPVRLTRNGVETAALRMSACARLVSDAWSSEADGARRAAARARENAATVVTKIELILSHLDSPALESPQ